MKKMKSIGYLQVFWFFVYFCGLSLILGFNTFSPDSTGFWFFQGIFITLFLFISYICINGYRRNWIEFGENKIIIHRFGRNKKTENQSSRGKWENRVDTVDLKELVRYGYTGELLNTHLEDYLYLVGKFPYSGEIFFELKNGKQIPAQSAYYTRKQTFELIQYIVQETGILPSGNFLNRYPEKKRINHR